MLSIWIQIHVIDFKDICELQVPPNLILKPDIHGSSPTRDVETIFLFIMHGCIFIYESWAAGYHNLLKIEPQK